MKTEFTASPETKVQGEPFNTASRILACVVGGDVRKVGIVQSVIGHIGVRVGRRTDAGLVVLVDIDLDTVKKYRAEAGASCWILVLTEVGSASAYLSAGASDVLSGGWSVNDLCDRIDVAVKRMATAPARQSSVVRERRELVSTYSRSEASGMVEWMLRGVEDTITRMLLAHSMVETRCPGVVLACEAVEDLRFMASELAAAVRFNPDVTASCDPWSVLAGGLGFPLLGEGRILVLNFPKTLPVVRGSRNALEHALRALVMPLVRVSRDVQIVATAKMNQTGDQLLIALKYEARFPTSNDEGESGFNDGPTRYQRTTDRLFAVAAAKISSQGGELLEAEGGGLLELRLPVRDGSVQMTREDAPEPMRVVLVEPDEALRGVLEQYFSMQSVQALALSSMEQADALIQRAGLSGYSPDVFVVAMQTAGGIPECPQLAAMSQLAPVIVTVSGDSDEAALARRIDGVSDVLRKPYTAEMLLSRAMDLALYRG